MPPAEPGVAEEIVGTIRRALDTLGFDSSSIGAEPIGLVVPGSAADALFDRAAEYLLDEAIALSLTSRIPIGGLGALDYGLCTSPTVRDALRLVVRYYGVVSQRARLDLSEDTDPVKLTFVRFPNTTYSRHWVEFPLAMIATRIKQTAGLEKFPYTKVYFQHPEPSKREAHDEFFGVRVEFGAKDTGMEFPASVLDLPLHTASKALSDLLEQRMKQLEPVMAVADPVLDRAHRTLVQMLDEGITDVDTLAARMGESKRTLQRMLNERNTSHSKMLDELRRQRASELLERGHKVADIAKQLAFSEPSAFFRAYRRWTGTSFRSARSDEIETGAGELPDSSTATGED